MIQDEGMLRFELGHYELNGYPLRPGDAVEIFTDNGWTLGHIAYEDGWYWIAPSGNMIRVGEDMRARFRRQYLREGWESEDVYDNELLSEKWSKGDLLPGESNAPPRSPNGLVILARNGRGKIIARIMGTRTANKLQGAMTTAREILHLTPGAARAEVHLYEGYESLYTGEPLAIFSRENVSPGD